MSINDEILNMSTKKVESLSNSEKKEYYRKLREYCKNIEVKKPKITLIQKIVSIVGPKTRNYDYEIRGTDNIPNNGAIIMCNHSNSHDAITMFETMSSIDRSSIVFAANEVVSPLMNKLFEMANFTLLNRNDKHSVVSGTYDFASKVMNGHNGFVFCEGTWNLHPIKAMLDLKVGSVKIAAISGKPIVPCIFEYIEVPYICEKEKDIYQKCIVSFGDPIFIDPYASLFEQTELIQNKMEDMRKHIWKENAIRREKISDIDPEIYVNHTGLKIFVNTLNFDPEQEKKFVFTKNGEEPVLMYTIDESGKFVPGSLTEKVFKKTIKK